MSDHFTTLLESVRALGASYGKLASDLTLDPDQKKIVDSYAQGLAGATAGLQRLGETYHRARTDEERVQLDTLAGASGVPEMLARANPIVASEPFQDQAALVEAAAWFRKTHRVIRDLVTPPGSSQIPESDVLRPIPWIERLLENIGRALAREDCLIEIVLLQFRVHSQGLGYPVRFIVEVGVDGEAFTRDLGGVYENKIVPRPFQFSSRSKGRCGKPVEVQFAANVRLLDAIEVQDFPKTTAQTTMKKTYTCPTHVDHEEMVLRRENMAGDIFYEFTFDFSVDMSCVKVSPP